MKKTRKERIICLGAIIFFATVFPSGDMRGKEAKKKKLYISTVKATGVAGALAERVKQGIKLSIFENYGKDYQILDDEAVKVMYAQAAKIMASGCTDTSCVEQIAEGINADEIIYGSVTSQAGMIKINISNMVRRKSGLDLKSLVSLSFRENQLDHYSREAGKKLINRRYAVKDPLELEDVKGEISLRGIEMQKISGITGVREIDEMGISVLKFSTGDEAAQRVLGYLKGLVQEGDESFRSKKYDDAIEKYKLVTERINSKLRAGSREKIAGFISEIDKRISTSYAMKYKSKMMKYKSMIEKIDPILSRGEWKSARNKWDDILKDMQKNVPAGTPGAVVEVFDGVKRRIEATYVIQFKPEIEKIDRKMKKRESVSESFLEDMLESYREVGTDLKHVPDNVWGNALYGIKGALSEREDSIIAMMVALRLKKGDAAYREYKFAEALKRYIEAHNLVLSIRDAKRSKELSDACYKRFQSTIETGINYVVNAVKSYTDRAEYFNIQEKTYDAYGMINKALTVMRGELKIFTSVEAFENHKKMADLLEGSYKMMLYEFEEIKNVRRKIEDKIDKKRRVIQERAEIELQSEKLKKRGYLKEKEIGGITFVKLPGGAFTMGSPDGIGDSDEHPQHRVTVDGFWMGKHEITQWQYGEIMGTNPSRYKRENLPVENVSWEDAVEFCKRFSARYKIKVRLPYEAEWEYACRAGSTTKYYWGDDFDGNYCWYNNNSGYKSKSPASWTDPNVWMLYDMIGNVSEWCMDWYDGDYYKKRPNRNPKGPARGSGRVVRGGSWNEGFVYGKLRSADRASDDPDTKSSQTGFRIVTSKL